MEHHIEKEVILPNLVVQLATVRWDGFEETPPYDGYTLSQRLSEDHSPLRLGNLSAAEVLPRVRSVGFLPPGRSIRLFPVEKPLRVLYCMYDKDFFEKTTGIPQQQWNEYIGLLVSIRNKRLEILMQEIYAELIQPDFGHELLIEAASTMILLELARYARKLAKKHAKHSDNQSLTAWQLRRIQERIEASLELGYPNLAELATLCGISQGHLMRTFKASTGWQIHKYIAEERVSAAKRMLAEEQINTKEISAKLGFRSPAYFATAFRRITGKTPSDYRHEIRAKSLENTNQH